MKRFIIGSLCAFILFFNIQPAFAIADAAVVLQLVKNLEEMKHQYNKLKEQYETLQSISKQGIGNYGWGQWSNSVSTLEHIRQWSPNNWKSALAGLSGGNMARYHQLLTEYKQNHKAMTPDAYAKGADSQLSRSYSNQVKTNVASGTMASYAFNRINEHLKTLQQLGSQLENAKKNQNLKSAIDLNSRIELEIGFIATSELRMMALLNHQYSAQQAHKIALENESSQYNQAGERP